MADNKMLEKLQRSGIASLDAGFAGMFGSTTSPAFEDDNCHGVELPVDQLFAFGYYDEERKKLHNIRPYTAEKLAELSESIKRNGILMPLLVRKRGDKEFEILAGHNRLAGAIKAGLSTVPCIVRDVDDDQSIIDMTDTNLYQRDELYPTDRGWAYRAQLDALNRQGQRTDLTFSQNGKKLDGKFSGSILAEKSGCGTSTIYRYVRLTYLTENYQNMVDDGKMSVSVGESISYLPLNTQSLLAEICVEKDISLTTAQANRIKSAFADKEASMTEIEKVLFGKTQSKVKKKEKAIRIPIPQSAYANYFSDKQPAEAEKIILQILEEYFSKKD